MSVSVAGAGVSRFKVLDGNLGLLQEYLRRDPESYRDEFMEQYQHFQQFVKILELEPKLHRSSVEQLLEVVNFLTAVAFCYAEEAKAFGKKLVELLFAKAEELGHELRLVFCRALIALRNANRMTSVDILPILFYLLKCDDKQLRKFIMSALLSIIKRTKIGSKSQKRKSRQRRRVAQLGSNGGASGVTLSSESSKIQAYIFSQLRDSCTTAARIAQNVLVLAYQKAFWRDAKTANVLAECVFHKLQRIQLSTMRFFLGSAEDEEGNGNDETDSEDDQKKDNAGVLHDAISSMHYAKKTKKRQRNLDRAKREMGKARRSRRESRAKFCNLEALNALYDPQRFADRLFGCLESKRNEKFVVRLLQIALCARVIGVHRLQTLGFYSYLHRYLQPKQREVTRVLLYAAQACHELVPPDVVQELVRRITQNFITDQNTPEAITVGLNTIREIFSNCPASATEELLRDLTEYKSYKNKNVSMAARSLVTLFRGVNPQLLHHKDRGRPVTDDGDGNTFCGASPTVVFGATSAIDFVPGAEVLPTDAPAADLPKKAPAVRRRKRGRGDDSEEDEEDWVDLSSDDDGEKDTVTGESQPIDAKEDEEAEEDDSGWVTDSDEEEEDNESGWETCSNDDDDDVEAEEDKQNGSDDKEDEVDVNEPEKPTKAAKKSVTFKLQSKHEKKKAKALEKVESQRMALEKAKLVSESRILTDSDFRAIRVAQARRQIAADRRGGAQKRPLTNDEVRLDEEIQEKIARRETGGDGLPRLNDIEHFHKKIYRQNKAERLEQAAIDRDEILEGRRKPKKNGPHVGRTNRELAKHKNYQMVKQKMRSRNRQRSFRDRQISLRNYLQKQSSKKF